MPRSAVAPFRLATRAGAQEVEKSTFQKKFTTRRASSSAPQDSLLWRYNLPDMSVERVAYLLPIFLFNNGLPSFRNNKLECYMRIIVSSTVCRYWHGIIGLLQPRNSVHRRQHAWQSRRVGSIQKFPGARKSLGVVTNVVVLVLLKPTNTAESLSLIERC